MKNNNDLYFCMQDDFLSSTTLSLINDKCLNSWFYFGEDSTWRVNAESQLQNKITRIHITDILDESVHEIRSLYIDWIGKLSQLNDSFEWWSSEIAAKNPYTLLFVKISLLLIFNKLIKTENITDSLFVFSSYPLMMEAIQIAKKERKNVIVLRDPKSKNYLKKSVKKTLSQILEISELFYLPEFLSNHSPKYQQILESNLNYRKKIIEKSVGDQENIFSDQKLVLFFTFIDKRSFNSDGGYKDIYFGNLPNKFKDAGFNVAFVPRILNTIPFDEAISKLLQSGEKFILMDNYLDKTDIIHAKMLSRKFKPALTDLVSELGFSVLGIANENIDQYRKSLAKNLLTLPVIKKLAEQGISPKYIIHPCEGHSWEKSLAWAVHNYMPSTKIVAYDNVTFSKMVLSMYPSKDEFDIIPLPDRIVTNGPLYRDVLLSEGYPEERVESGYALRHNYLWNVKINPDKYQGLSGCSIINILVATAIGFGDSVELVAKAIDAFGGNERFRVLIKCHPLVNVGLMKKYFASAENTQNITFVTDPVDKLLVNSQILLYTYTSVCYEAILHGTFPIFVKSESFLNLDKLDICPEVRWVASTSEELQDIVDTLMGINAQDYKIWLNKSEKIVALALAPIEDNYIKSFLI